MRRFTLFKNLVGMYGGDKTITVLPTDAVVEVTAGAVPLGGIIEVRHNGRMIRVFANDFHNSAKADDPAREGSD